MFNLRTLAAASAISTIVILTAGVASAASVTLDSTTQCSAGNAINEIAVTDVTGDAGGATDCWGTFDGNDSNLAMDGFIIGSATYTEIAKIDVGENGNPDVLSGVDIGLSITGQGTSSGRWEVDGVIGGAFLIVLKAANSPGFAAWLFEGSDAASTSGSWRVVWNNNSDGDPLTYDGPPAALSHFAVYQCAECDGPPPTTEVPLPAGAWLLLGGLGLLGGARKLWARQT